MRSTTPAVTPENAKARRWRVALVSLLALVPLTLAAQMPQSANWADEILKKEGYVQPPKELADAVLAPRHLNITLSSLSPDKTLFLDEIGDGPPAMAVFATPYHELGGVFVDYKANRVHSLTARGNVGIQTISAADGTRRNIAIPANARVSGARWSPDGKSIAYMAHTPEATHIWITDVATNKPRQITKTPLLATFVTSFEFVNGGKQIAAVLIPDGRRAMPAEPAAPTGPEVRLSDIGDRNRLRTFPSLMSTPHHFDLLEYHTTGQIALIDVATQAVTRVGAPTIVRSIDFSPDGKYARVTRMTKPFSYIVPVNNFGQVEEVWDGAGKALAELSKREINLGVQNDDPPADPAQAGGGRGRGGAGQAGKREVAWRPDGQGFTYLEQEPAPAGSGAGRAGRGGRGANADAGGGDDAAQGQQGRGQQAQQQPDRVYQWLPPFDDASKKVIYENSARMSGHRYSPDMKMLFYRETQGQNWTDYAVDLATPTERFTLLRQRNNDFYANPGTILATSGAGGGGGRGGGGRGGGGGGGGPVMISADGTSVFYSGTQYDRKPDAVAPKAFIDKVNIRTGAKERIYESNNDGVSERVTSVLDVDAKRFVISSESPTTVPQQYLLDNGNRKRLTNNEDIAPDLTAAPKQRFTVERADGFTFRVTVNLPAGYQAGTRLPALFWFYPREYSTQQAYDEPDRTYNKNAFQNFGARSMEYFVRLGYAVVEPDSPIVGEAGAMNNNYEHDLRNNLAAVIDELDRRALVDRNRLAIGGHSYGAFSTVNAMVHTPFFKAGIAGDGNYNRTLTPMGFQNERRIFWDAPSVYISMSPFFQANNLTGALLMYHGAHDQNVGTDPDNSLRLFHALNGLGKTVALYMYPLEDHGPATRETLLDLWARWAAWLDKYVKNPQKDVKPAANGGGGR